MININLDTKAQKLIGKVAEDESDLIVNPELTDEEPDLTGIQYKGVKYKVPQGGQGGVKTRTFSFIGDVQCYGGQAKFIYESEDDTPSYVSNNDTTQEQNEALFNHFISELADGRIIYGIGAWEQDAQGGKNIPHPVKMYVDDSRVFVENLDESGFDFGISASGSDYMCDVLNG